MHPNAKCWLGITGRWPATVLGVVLMLGGCGKGPRAPGLEDGPVFVDAREGLRFLVPQKWVQTARGVMPPGRLEQERMIVDYKITGTAKPASFRVTCIDLADGANIPKYVVKEAPSGWHMKGPPKAIEVHGMLATRTALTGPDQYAREVVAFRRGERVYLFTGIWAASDHSAREQIEHAIESVILEN